uniref:hypothetical protein n=1 Tax=Escherichia coli TaxID=562 RepID=UPI001BD50B75
WSTSKTPSYTKSVSWQHHPHVRNRFTSMDIGMNSQILPDMLINFALINITDRKNEGTNTIDGNWQADERRRYRDNVRIYF